MAFSASLESNGIPPSSALTTPLDKAYIPLTQHESTHDTGGYESAAGNASSLSSQSTPFQQQKRASSRKFMKLFGQGDNLSSSTFELYSPRQVVDLVLVRPEDGEVPPAGYKLLDFNLNEGGDAIYICVLYSPPRGVLDYRYKPKLLHRYPPAGEDHNDKPCPEFVEGECALLTLRTIKHIAGVYSLMDTHS